MDKKNEPVVIKGSRPMSVRVPNPVKLVPKGLECTSCRATEGSAHKMSCDPPYRLRKADLDVIEQLIEVSDQCLTMHPQIDGDKLLERPCNCRANVKKILRKAGFDMKKLGRTP